MTPLCERDRRHTPFGHGRQTDAGQLPHGGSGSTTHKGEEECKNPRTTAQHAGDLVIQLPPTPRHGNP
ncbi:hypothetical protein QFZ43_001028 [Streptomyces afghaniensis]|nr:hypothetical protein [Streptomyces afghaniensis]